MPTKPTFTSAAELDKRIDEYFAHCSATRTERALKSGDVRIRQEWPTMIGLARWLGIGKATLYRYLDGTALSADSKVPAEEQQRIRDSIAGARDRVEAELLQAAAEGSVEPRTAQLLLHSFGYDKPPETEAAVTVHITGSEGNAKSWSE